MKTSSALTALLLFAAMQGAAFADTVVLLPQKDNTLYEDPFGSLSNGQGLWFFTGKTAADSLRRGLIAFDFSSIPTNATITGATLTMFVSLSHGSSASVSLSKALRDWGEGASDAGEPGGAGVQAETGDATWIHTFYDTSFLAQCWRRLFIHSQRDHDSQLGQHNLHVEQQRNGRGRAGVGFQSGEQLWMDDSRQ